MTEGPWIPFVPAVPSPAESIAGERLTFTRADPTRRRMDTLASDDPAHVAEQCGACRWMRSNYPQYPFSHGAAREIEPDEGELYKFEVPLNVPGPDHA